MPMPTDARATSNAYWSSSAVAIQWLDAYSSPAGRTQAKGVASPAVFNDYVSGADLSMKPFVLTQSEVREIELAELRKTARPRFTLPGGSIIQ